MSDVSVPSIVNFQLSADQQASLQKQLDAVPALRAALESLRPLGIDPTSGHAQLDAMSATVQNLLTVFGTKPKTS